METFANVWLAGGLAAGGWYLYTVVWPEVRLHFPANRLVEACRFGPRMALVVALWPLAAVLFACIWLADHQFWNKAR